MIKLHSRLVFRASILVLWIGSASAQKAPDARLSGSYSLMFNHTSVWLSVCGSTRDGSSGCWFNEPIGSSFDQACAILEGPPQIDGRIVTRLIYVLDRRTSDADPIQLYVFTRRDKVQPGGDQVTVELTKQISLGRTGGAQSHCSMAANDKDVFAGTDASSPLRILKSNYHVFGAYIGTTLSITADERGYVAVSTTNGFVIYDPQGRQAPWEGGGRQDFADVHNAFVSN